MAPVAARFWGDPTEELRVVGVTGTNGKTTTAFLIREVLEAAGDPVRAVGDREAGRRRRRGGGGADDAGGDRPPGDLQADARGRRPGLRDGGLLARPGSPPRRRDPLRGGAVHEPDPGPPRLPRRHGGLLRGEAAAVRDGAAARDRQRRRPLRPPPRRGLRRRDLLGRRRRGRLLRPRRRPSTRAAPGSGSGTSRSAPGCPATSTSPTRWRHSRRRGRWESRRPPSPRRSPPPVRPRVGSSRSRRASRSPSSSTMPTPRTRSTTCWRRRGG